MRGWSVWTLSPVQVFVSCEKSGGTLFLWGIPKMTEFIVMSLIIQQCEKMRMLHYSKQIILLMVVLLQLKCY